MRHGLALLLKAVIVAAVFYIMLTSLNGYPIGPTLLLALLTTGMSYLIGDMLIFPLSNNLTATLADIGLSTGTIWIIGSFFYGVSVPLNLAIWTSILLAVGEWFFHIYLANFVFGEDPTEAVG